MDCATAVDLHTGKPVDSARFRIAGSYTEPEMGHLNRTIFAFDDITLLLAGQQPGVDSPYFDYVFHPDHEEVEVVLAGKGLMCYADGAKYDVKSGNCMYHGAGYPHRLHNAGDETLELLVMLSGHIKDCTRQCSPEEVHVENNGGHKLVFCPEQPALTDHNLAGFAGDGCELSLIYDGDNICYAYVVLKPGCVTPAQGFASNTKFNEVIYVFKGTGLAVYPDKTYNLKPDMAIYNPPGQGVRYENNSGEDLVLCCFYPTGKLADVSTVLE